MKKIILSAIISSLSVIIVIFILMTFTGVFGTPKFIYMHSYVSSIFPDEYRNGFVRPENIEKISIGESNMKEVQTNLKYCENIKSIDIYYPSDEPLDNLSFLENQSNVSRLYIAGKFIDWSGMSSCKNTTALSIMQSNFRDIEILKDFSDLRELDIQTDSYVNYQGFDTLNSLERFYILASNADIAQIVKATSLNYLHIRYNKELTNFADFTKSTSIKYLEFSDSVINKEYLEVINQMKWLEKLEFDVSLMLVILR